jgi:DNA polymerase/3'-5' exonuclease PolX
MRLMDPSEPVTVEEAENLGKLARLIRSRLMVGFGQVKAKDIAEPVRMKNSRTRRQRAGRLGASLESLAHNLRDMLEEGQPK